MEIEYVYYMNLLGVVGPCFDRYDRYPYSFGKILPCMFADLFAELRVLMTWVLTCFFEQWCFSSAQANQWIVLKG